MRETWMRRARRAALGAAALVAAAALCGAGLLRAPAAGAADEQCFPETGKCLQGRFLAYWQAHGGLATNGYPLSGEFQQRLEDGKPYTVQYFERVRMEYHPENQPPYDVELGQFGRDIHPADPAVAPQAGDTYFQATGHNVAPDFYAYWLQHGGLDQFGYPLTEEIHETLDGRDYVVQYFERARFERHPENPAPWDIELGQFGRRIFTTSLAALQQPCRSADLAASVAWNAGAGQRIGDITYRNQSPAPCALTGRPQVQVVDGQGQPIGVPPAGGDAGTGDGGPGLILQPTQTALQSVRFGNWCGDRDAPQALLITLPQNGGQSTVSPVSVPPCLGNVPPAFDSGPLTMGPTPAVQTLRAFYEAIDSKDYHAAYNLLGAAWQQRQSYDDFASGYADTEFVTPAILTAYPTGSDGAILNVVLTAKHTDGSTHHYAGTYTVAPEGNGLRIVAASIAQTD
ncbi:MAG TPA: DUF4232 domain-containing protein [Thermomicrobiales bacterium]|nr:DUF4232 domain-containing protein [Thermomicrobiales bacterium]